MASTINASTSGLGGIITTGDNSGTLALQTGGTTALTVSNSQVVNFVNAPTVAGIAMSASPATPNSSGTVFGQTDLYSSSSVNAFFGSKAGVSTTGIGNTGLATYALYTNTSGQQNTAVGYASLYYNTSGSQNVAVGKDALSANTSASQNTAVGYQAGYSLSTSPSNVFVGYQAGYSTTNASNTHIGYQAGYSATSGTNNTTLGSYAGYSLTTGIGNTFVGGSYNYGSGYYVTTGSKNTVLGSYDGNQGGLDIRTSNNYIVLSDGDGNPRGYFDNNGYFNAKSIITSASGAAQITAYNTNSGGTGYAAVSVQNSTGRGGYLTVGDNSATSTYWFHAGAVTLAATANAALYLRANADDTVGLLISTNGNIGAPTGSNIYNASDFRLKKNIQPITKGLDVVNALKPVSFNWITDFCKEENDKTLYGFIAQDTKDVDENLVEGFNNGGTVTVGDLTVDNPLRVNEKFIIPMLVNAIQELNALVTVQAETITAMQSTITALQAKVGV